MSLLEPIVPRRRNGKQQACEPCRKRKLACDHTFPICNRCQHRKIASSCVYHAAPMTKAANGEETAPIRSSSPRSSTADLHDPPSLPILNISSAIGEHRRSKSYTDAGKLLSQTALFSNASGFLGPTSFSSVLLENCSRLDIDDDTESPPMNEASLFDAHFIRLGARVLSQLPDPHSCQRLSEMHGLTGDSWAVPGWDRCQDSLWSTYGSYLAKPRKMQDLETVARILSKNTATPLAEPDDPKEWLESFSGRNLRWEVLGNLFIEWGYGAISSPENSPFFREQEGKRKDRKEFTLEMKECASSCITLCSRTEVNNTLLVYLLYKHNLLDSVCSGDTSSLIWRQHGDLISMTTALGLHRQAEKSLTKYTVASETRKRVFAGIFAMDKILATFTGRPPGIGRRYTSCLLPLDVSDEALLLPEAELAKVAATSVDKDGWSTSQEVYSATWLRVIMLFAFYRDEILEVSLGSSPANLAETLVDLKHRLTECYNTLPSHLQYNPSLLYRSGSSSDLMFRLSTRLEHLQGHFLLERLMIKHGLTTGQAMLDSAREMLGLVLVFWTHRDQFQGHQHDFEWLIMYYGVPPSGALCVELLKQTKERDRPQQQNAGLNGNNAPLHLPRSETIQQLSMFVGFLDWVKPTAPNSDLCFRIRGIISKVLDQILDSPPASQVQQQQQQQQQQNPDEGNNSVGNANGGGVDQYVGVNGTAVPAVTYGQPAQTQPLLYDFDLPSDWIVPDEMSNFDLLDTFDWTRPPNWGYAT